MKLIKAALAALCLSATSATAVPLGWSFDLTDTFGTIDGSFIYDADTDSYSDFDITFTASGGSPITINNLYNFFAPFDLILWSTPSPSVGGTWMNLDIDNPLTNAGGTIGADLSLWLCNAVGTNLQGCFSNTGNGGGRVTLTSFVPPANLFRTMAV